MCFKEIKKEQNKLKQKGRRVKRKKRNRMKRKSKRKRKRKGTPPVERDRRMRRQERTEHPQLIQKSLYGWDFLIVQLDYTS